MATTSPAVALSSIKCLLLNGLIISCVTTPGLGAPQVIAWGDNTTGQTNVPAGLTHVVSIAGGQYHCLGLNASGTVVGWGLQGYLPQVPADLRNVTGVSAGNGHDLALRNNGTVIAWGDNLWGQTNVPPALSNVVAVAASASSSLALKADGTLVRWGYDNSIPAGLTNVVAVSAARTSDNVLALRGDGSVIAWGDNSYGQANVPSGLAGIVAISAGRSGNLALMAAGTVVAWGSYSFVPEGLSNVVAIACGDYANLALRSDGTVLAWGNDYYGQVQVPANVSNAVAVADAYQASLALVGDGPPYVTAPMLDRVVADTMPVSFYIQATGAFPLSYQWSSHGTNLPGATNAILTLPEVRAADAGVYSVVISNAFGAVTNSCALKVEPFWITRAPQNGSSFPGGDTGFDVVVAGRDLAYQWRFNGIDLPGQTTSSLSLANVQFDNAGNYSVVVSNPVAVREVSATLSMSHLAAWGTNNSSGQLNVPAGITNIVDIAAGADFVLALLSDGRVSAWGNSASGKTSVPAGLSNVVKVAAGNSHSLALKSDGTVVGWGTFSVFPGLNNVAAIAAGGSFSLVLKTNGTLYAWGFNSSGQTSIPAGLSNVVAIACGFAHSLALKGDGTVTGWGANAYGQTSVPAGLSNVVAVAAGPNHSLALRADGSVVAWGSGSSLTNVPADTTNITTIAAGRDIRLGGLALRGDGKVLQWGTAPMVPQRLTNVVAVAAGIGSCFGLIGDGPPFAAEPPLARTVSAGRDTCLRVRATGLRPLAYQWRFKGADLPGATSPFLTIANFQPENVGLYAVSVRNDAGSLTTAPALVDLSLFITAQPATQIVPAGSTAFFSVAAVGFPPLSFQWRKNGTDLIGATSSTLTLEGVQASDVGLYQVLVTDPFGQSATSDSAWLSIGTPGTGSGLSGDYYGSRYQTFAGLPTFSRVDPMVDFDWSTNAPDPRISGDNFTVRWTGEVQPFATGTYTFYTRADDGLRLWVDGRLLIDKWIPQSVTEWSNSLVLTGGTRYPLVLEYFEATDRATARLSWSSELQPKMVVPRTQLYPSAFSPAVPPLTWSCLNGTNLVLSWAGSYGVQSSVNVTGVYTLLYSGRSPFTNNLFSSQRFFRLISR